jgi:hypothetical protein
LAQEWSIESEYVEDTIPEEKWQKSVNDC